ncbi:polyisoprenoid diphosphate/phosphate phosphohydrolase PLPP6 isoform X2 [Rhodnius prolixus]|uniref:polyisoprenoid diphosphate/phosphate phosphohydrolase PLPP6 isoform X2 n=1 Tax=Rhodnius prolixus TaxID=13249 RepID=UPI003D1895DA
MTMGEPSQRKRQVPTFLQTLLKLDVSATTLFCKNVDKIISPVKYRKYYKVLEISCHALPWLSLTLASLWILWSEALFQSQINFLLGLIIDIIDISLLKAFTRRRRPAGNHSDMFFTVGPDQYSFPSGHVSRAVFVTCFFIRLQPTYFILHLLLILWTLAICFSRILLRRHYILDVLGGCILGLAEASFLSCTAGVRTMFSRSLHRAVMRLLGRENLMAGG